MTNGYRYDAEIAEALAPFAEIEPVSVPRGDWRALREVTTADYEGLVAISPPAPSGVAREEVTISSEDGVVLDARWYTRGDDRPGSAVVYAHGGGMVAGTLDHYDATVAEYVHASGVPFLSVAYRLAPESRGAVPAEDLLAAVAWLSDQSERLGVEPARIAVMGDSAGGGIAVSAAILARDRRVRLAHQILVYPMLDDRVTSASAALEPFLIWSPDKNATGWAARLDASAPIDAITAPARLEDYRGLPPTYLEVGDLDLFRDEGIAFAQRLAQADVPIELHVHPSVPHGFDMLAPNAGVTRRAKQDRVRALSLL